MTKGHPRFDWYTSASECEWLHADEPLEEEPTSVTRRGALRQHASILGCIVLLLIFWGRMWYRDGAVNSRRQLERQERLEQEARRAVEPESELAQTAALSGQGGYPLGAIAAQHPTKVEVGELSLYGNYALAHTTVDAPTDSEEPAPYRVLHFYQQAEQSWELIDPVPELLGPWQTVETPHFIIRHRQFDAETVVDVVHRLEQLYTKLRRDTGLPLTAPAKITIELLYDSPDDAYLLYYQQRIIQVPSPALLQIPTEWTDDVVLYGALVYPLARFVTIERREEAPSAWQENAWVWQPVLKALRLWELWESETPLADRKVEILRWLYNDNAASKRWLLPERYEEICRTYGVWQLMPIETEIPLTCQHLDPPDPYTSKIPRHLHIMAPLPKPHLNSEWTGTDPVVRKQTMGSTIGLATVLDYAVATHGIEMLPTLIGALGDHEDWETLIPDVYGVSADEFEAGWLAYMEAQYR